MLGPGWGPQQVIWQLTWIATLSGSSRVRWHRGSEGGHQTVGTEGCANTLEGEDQWEACLASTFKHSVHGQAVSGRLGLQQVARKEQGRPGSTGNNNGAAPKVSGTVYSDLCMWLSIEGMPAPGPSPALGAVCVCVCQHILATNLLSLAPQPVVVLSCKYNAVLTSCASAARTMRPSM